MSVPDFLQQLRDRAPDAPALSSLTGLTEDFRWTYRQLLQTALGFRGALVAGGVHRNCRVCVIAGNCPQFIALFLACVDLGATFVPVHHDQAAATLAGMLRQLHPHLVIVDDDLQGKLLKTVLRESGTVWRLRLRRTPWLRPVLSGTRHDREPEPAQDVDDASKEQNPVLLLHSSGSTGAPKVIEYSRTRLNVFLHWQRHLFSAFPDVPGTGTPSPRVNALPLTHFGGLSFVLQALLDGRLVFLPRALAPFDYLRLAVRERCQLLMLVPALYDELPDTATEVFSGSSLRYCLTMGEAAPSRLLAAIRRTVGARVYSAYGMSEGLSGLTHHGDPPPDSCGSPAFGDIRLVGIDGTDAVGDDAEGELWVRNETTFPCYRDPALNAMKFVDGWYRTGDWFRRDAAGHHYFIGRVDAMCVINGRNVYPAEVEQVLLRHADVTDCMAAVITLDKGRKRLGVLACVRPDSSMSPASLTDWYLEHGALHATPAWVLLGKGIPRNAAGKRDRLAVASLLQHDYQSCLKKVS